MTDERTEHKPRMVLAYDPIVTADDAREILETLKMFKAGLSYDLLRKLRAISGDFSL